MTVEADKMAAVMRLDENKSIKDRPLMIKSIVMIVLVVLGFVFHSTLGVDSCIIALASATILLLIGRDRAADNGVFTDQAAGIGHKLDSLFAHLGKVALIMLVDNLPIAHDNDLNGRRADVDSYVYIHKYPFSPV